MPTDDQTTDLELIRLAQHEANTALDRYLEANARLSKLMRYKAYHDQERALGHRAPRVPEGNLE